MGKLSALTHHFAQGEVSQAALARVDQERLRLAAEIQENVFPHVIGKGQVRPGTKFIGNTTSNAKARLLRFVRSPTETALIEASNGLARFMVDDTLVTRPSVTSTVNTGGWTVTVGSGAAGSVSSGVITLSAAARGSSATASQAVTTSSTNTEHALRIVITRGNALFRVGSSSGGGEYISETTLSPGTHSLAFTPTASPYYIQFVTRSEVPVVINSCAIESAGVVSITAPWSEADLPLIRYDQSVDVMFLACASWQPRKIERRNSGRSWSLVLYESNDGPFTTAATNNVFMTATKDFTGQVSVIASSPTFTSNHVGSLIRVVPSGFNTTFELAGADQYTDAIRVYGSVDQDTWFTIVVSGTWVGTINLQRSYDGPDSGFIDVPAGSLPLSGNATVPVQTQEILNVPIWYRAGFKAAEYTSGVASVQMVYNGGSSAGVYRIVEYVSSLQVAVVTLSSPSSYAATKNWSFGAWSDAAGWPSSVGFFDGRLWFGGDDKFWGSESDDYYAFNLDDEGAAGSIQRTVATGGTMNDVRWILPLQRMIMGCSGAEISARSSSFDEPLTPTNVTLKDAATQGVAEISPVKVDGRGFYVHRDGLQVMEISYDVDSNDYRANSVMLLNDEIGGDGFTELAVQRSPETYVWTVREDGQCPILIYNPKEKTVGWHRFIGAPSVAGVAVVESVQVLPSANQDRVYLIVKRTINGSVVRTIEKLARHSEAEGGAANYMADSYITVAGPVTTVSGLSHLIGETVVAWGTTSGVTGPIGTTYTVNGSGEITLPSSSTNVCVGLAYSWRYKSAKLAYGTQGGTTLLMPKRVATIGMALANTHPNGLQYGSDFTTMRKMPRTEDGQTISETATRTVYDEKTFAFGGNWDTDARVCLKGSAPYPCTLLALVVGIESNED